MRISKLLTDNAILAEIGQRIAQRRLELQLTQADVAEQAGVAKRTLERMEAGASAQMSSFVRICRVLELLPNLDSMIEEVGPSPMELLKGKGKQRQRASSRRQKNQVEEAPWAWDDDK